MSAVGQLLELIDDPDPFRNAPADLHELQMEAARERFAHARSTINVLDRRATDEGIDAIRTTADLIPLLFAHTNYKSYPESFIDKGQWANMNRWLQTLSTRPVDVDVDGVEDVDDWIERLRENGHQVFATSGTSGKSSFMNRTEADRGRFTTAYLNASNWATPHYVPAGDRHAFGFMPPIGSHVMCEISRVYMEQVGSEETIHYLSTERLRAMQTIRAGQMRRAIAAGTAKPEEIAAFDREVAETRETMEGRMEAILKLVLDSRHEPIVLAAQWPLLYRIVEMGRARGIRDGSFHPDTIITIGGGVKGATLPADYREQVFAFFGIAKENYGFFYGMSETTGVYPYSHADEAYVVPPWIIPLVLDKSGEQLIEPNGDATFEGRYAVLDLAVEGRWGGVISGDKVAIDFAASPDGVVVPKVRSVARFADLEEGEDKLSCAGTIETYVRGNIGV